jgi:hypothetical protein
MFDQRSPHTQVCSKADAKVQITAAKAWVTQPKSCLKGKRFAFLQFTLRDLKSDSGVKDVSLYTKASYAAWYQKYLCVSSLHSTPPCEACLTVCDRLTMHLGLVALALDLMRHDPRAQRTWQRRWSMLA